MDCPSCGARIIAGETECPYCRRRVQQSDSTPPERAKNPILSAHSRELEELLRYTPSSTVAGAGQVALVVFGSVFTAFALFFIVTSRRGGAPLFFQLFPIIFLLVGLAMVGGGIRGLVKLSTSPLERLPSVVAGKRQEYSSSSRGSGSTSYYVTIETEDGQRKEHPVRGRLYGEVQRGDVGVAYVKGGFLLDFKRVRFPKA
jgi:hypothetical protein